jgi:hypothetical protein
MADKSLGTAPAIPEQPRGICMRGISLGVPKNHHKNYDDKENYEYQSGKLKTVGGHAENFSVQDGFLIKKSNRTEGRFYEQLKNHELGLSDFMPHCAKIEYSPKTLKLKKHNQGYSIVFIEDLRQGFQQPIIYDIKLGTRTVSSKELRVTGSRRSDILRKDLRLHMADEISSSSKRGYRFVGSSMSHDSRVHLGTHPDEMIEHIAAHLCRNDLMLVVAELENLTAYLKTKEGRRFEFIGASVLIVAESESPSKASVQAATPKVKLIDFAHSNIVGPKGLVLDNGMLHTSHRKRLYQQGLRFGLANLAKDLRVILEKKTNID